MHRTLARPALTIALLAVLLGISPARLPAGNAPSPAAVAGATPTADGELCSAAEIALGEEAIAEAPAGAAGIVNPVADPASQLYVVVVTLPPGSCAGYHPHDGAVVLVVQQGTIEYAYRARSGEPALGVEAGDANGADIPLTAGSPVSLPTGAWVTEDRPVEHTFRNPGTEPAVVALAAYGPIAGEDSPEGGCMGGCRKR